MDYKKDPSWKNDLCWIIGDVMFNPSSVIYESEKYGRRVHLMECFGLITRHGYLQIAGGDYQGVSRYFILKQTALCNLLKLLTRGEVFDLLCEMWADL